MSSANVASRSVAAGVILAAALSTTRAAASGPLGANGARIRTSRYSIDLTEGPVLAGTRATGLGGAYVALAEGVDGDLENPAAPAVRPAWSVDHFDYDLGLGLLFPSSVEQNDFFNTGKGPTDLRRSNQQEFAFLTPAANLELGPWGLGLTVELQRYGLRRTGPAIAGIGSALFRAQFSTVQTELARSVDNGQLIVGLGFSVTALDVTNRNEILTRSGNVFTTRGLAFEGGVVWRPNAQRFRFGLAARAPLSTAVQSQSTRFNSDIVLGDPKTDPNAIWLPFHVKRPWSADAGVAVELGSRPLNPHWIDPSAALARLEHFMERRRRRRKRQRAQSLAQARSAGRNMAAAARAIDAKLATEQALDELRQLRARRRVHALLKARYRAMSRFRLLLCASLHADGRVANAVGIESFLQGYVDRSGQSVTLSPHLGLETEPLPGRLVLRNGAYLEPSRFEGGHARLHGTWGADVKLFSWSAFGLAPKDAAWQIGGAVDVARQYFSWGVSAGLWR